MFSYWNGECFVFDDRVSLNMKLHKGSYFQCYGCRRAITKKDMKSKYYLKGARCYYCYQEKNISKIKNSLERQKQIDTAKKNKTYNPFIKIEFD